MSWATSQYDENPFSDPDVERNSNPAAKKPSTFETPPWLQDTVKNETSFSEVPLNSSGPTSPASTDPTIPRMILYTRVINLFLSICMIVVSLLSLLTTQTATTGVLACYVVVFSCLLCCFETHLKQVSKIIALNFGFMYSAKSRSVFMIFLGTILFSFSLFGKLIGIFMLVNAGFNIYILFKYPQFDDAQRSDAQSEIKDYLAANPAFAQKILDSGVQVGTDIIRNNPDIARQSAEVILTTAAQQRAGDSRGNYAQV